MKTDFYISNTNDLGKNEITKHLGVVSAHIVIGANFFADFFASFTDFFGGHSSAYQERLEEMFGKAKKNLIKEAKQRGANGIIGFTVDFDEISGKDKSMFMLSAIGTAVHVEVDHENSTNEPEITGLVSAKKLTDTIRRMTMKERIINLQMPNKEEWALIISSMPELVEIILPAYIEEWVARLRGKMKWKSGSYEVATECLPLYLQSIEPEQVAGVLYPILYDHEPHQYMNGGIEYNITKASIALRIAIDNKIISMPRIFAMVDEFEKMKGWILELLEVEKAYYDKNDLLLLEKMISIFETLPTIRKKEIVTTGVFSKKTKEVIECKCGNEVREDQEYCPYCKRNRFGLTPTHVEIISTCRLRVAALKTFF